MKLGTASVGRYSARLEGGALYSAVTVDED